MDKNSKEMNDLYQVLCSLSDESRQKAVSYISFLRFVDVCRDKDMAESLKGEISKVLELTAPSKAEIEAESAARQEEALPPEKIEPISTPPSDWDEQFYMPVRSERLDVMQKQSETQSEPEKKAFDDYPVVSEERVELLYTEQEKEVNASAELDKQDPFEDGSDIFHFDSELRPEYPVVSDEPIGIFHAESEMPMGEIFSITKEEQPDPIRDERETEDEVYHIEVESEEETEDDSSVPIFPAQEAPRAAKESEPFSSYEWDEWTEPLQTPLVEEKTEEAEQPIEIVQYLPKPPASRLLRAIRVLHLRYEDLAFIFNVSVNTIGTWFQLDHMEPEQESVLEYLSSIVDRADDIEALRLDLILKRPFSDGEFLRDKLKNRTVRDEHLEFLRNTADTTAESRRKFKGSAKPFYAFQETMALYAIPLYSEVR